MDLKKIEDGLASLCPLGRVAVPQDIGRVVAFLAHSDSEWVNGEFTRCLILMHLTNVLPRTSHSSQWWIRYIDTRRIFVGKFSIAVYVGYLDSS
jgi:hypothetical protein